MRVNTHPADQRCAPGCGCAEPLQAEKPHGIRLRRETVFSLVSWLLLVVICVAWDSANVCAGFVLPEVAKLAGPLTNPGECFQSAVCASSLTTDDAAGQMAAAKSSGAESIKAVKRDSPGVPALPFEGVPSVMVLFGGFASAASGRSSTGAAPTSSGGGVSGAFGIFDPSWNLQSPQLVSRLQFGEVLNYPTAPPSDVFRPPPITTLSS